MSRRTPGLRVGGQALADGVLMRTGEIWAVARIDGSVEMGRLPVNKLARVPLLRVLSGLGPALSRGLRAMGRSRRSSRNVPARVRWALVVFLAVPLAVELALGRLLDVGPMWGWRSGVQVIGLVAAQLAVLRLVMPAAMWRFHGAEHKAVAAFEQGVDLDDIDAVARCSRVHNRCGTNVVSLIVLAALLPLPTGGIGGFVALAAVLATAVELVTLAARFPGTRYARVVLSGGRALQRWVTTSEPTRAELEVGVRALRLCLGALAAEQAAGRVEALAEAA